MPKALFRILSDAFVKQPAEVIESFLAKVSTNSLGKALFFKNSKYQENFLCVAAALPTEVFLAFINKISTVTLDAALILWANDRRISLMTAAISQSETGFMVLIDKASFSAINKTLKLLLDNGWTLLHVTCCFP